MTLKFFTEDRKAGDFMYIHLGQNTVVNDKEIIGVFDLESTTVSKKTRDYLSKNEKKKNVYYVSSELPRSFVVCDGRKIFVSHLSSQTIAKRAQSKGYPKF